MATQYWDSTQNVRGIAETIDLFLYENGITKPKTKVYKSYTEEEYRAFLDGLREELWGEHTKMMKDMGYEK